MWHMETFRNRSLIHTCKADGIWKLCYLPHWSFISNYPYSGNFKYSSFYHLTFSNLKLNRVLYFLFHLSVTFISFSPLWMEANTRHFFRNRCRKPLGYQLLVTIKYFVVERYLTLKIYKWTTPLLTSYVLSKKFWTSLSFHQLTSVNKIINSNKTIKLYWTHYSFDFISVLDIMLVTIGPLRPQSLFYE